jgi:hypothetical protein
MMALRTTTALPLHLLPVMPTMQARAGAGAWVITMPSALDASNSATAAPANGYGAKDILCFPSLVAAPPPNMPLMSIAQFARTLLPFKTDMPGYTPQAISAAGTPPAQFTGLTAPRPSSAPLWPVAIAVVVVLVVGVHGRCHHSGKPMQAGGVVDQVSPARAHQVRQGTPCNGAATAANTAVSWRGGQCPIHKCQQHPHCVG